MEVRAFSESCIAIDDRYAPLLITTFAGRLSLEAAQWYDDTSTRLINGLSDAGHKLISISDGTRTSSLAPEVRRCLAERVAHARPETLSAMLGMFVVGETPKVRAMSLATRWRTPRADLIEVFPTLIAAIETGKKRLEAFGHSLVAIDAKSYRAPDLVSRADQATWQAHMRSSTD